MSIQETHGHGCPPLVYCMHYTVRKDKTEQSILATTVLYTFAVAMINLDTPWYFVFTLILCRFIWSINLSHEEYIRNNAWVSVNNDFFGHEWGNLPMIFTSDEVTRENLWQITSRMNKKSLFTVTNVLFHFLDAIFFPSWTQIPLKTSIERSFRHCRPRTVFSDLAL